MAPRNVLERTHSLIKLCVLAVVVSCMAYVGLAYTDAKDHIARYRELVGKRHGMVESGGHNRGPHIDRANRQYAYLGAPYCASCGSLDLDSLGVLYPVVRSSRSRAFRTELSVDAREVWRLRIPVPVPSIAVFTRMGGGHYAFVWKVAADSIYTFEYNTTPDGGKGSWYDGKWSGFKVRALATSCAPTNPNRITHFTPVIFHDVSTTWSTR